MTTPTERARVQGVGRMFDNERAVLVILDRKLSDNELRDFHDALRTHPSQPGVREALAKTASALGTLKRMAEADKTASLRPDERAAFDLHLAIATRAEQDAFAALSHPSQSAGVGRLVGGEPLPSLEEVRDLCEKLYKDQDQRTLDTLIGEACCFLELQAKALAAPSHIEGEADEDALILRMLYELHAHMPEIERPMSMSDLSDEQTARARNAVRAIRAGERETLERAAKVAEGTGGAPDRSTLRAMIAARIRSLSSQPEQDEQGGR